MQRRLEFSHEFRFRSAVAPAAHHPAALALAALVKLPLLPFQPGQTEKRAQIKSTRAHQKTLLCSNIGIHIAGTKMYVCTYIESTYQPILTKIT
jgi:hypothetical protein